MCTVHSVHKETVHTVYMFQTLSTPKPPRRKTSLAEVIPDWPELKPFKKKRQVFHALNMAAIAFGSPVEVIVYIQRVPRRNRFFVRPKMVDNQNRFLEGRHVSTNEPVLTYNTAVFVYS